MLKYKKMSKPLMEKKRRERINTSLEQLKSLLEKHYTYNVRKKKLEKADILELTVKHIHNLLSIRQQVARAAVVNQQGIHEYKAGFRGCLDKLNEYLIKTKVSGEKMRTTGSVTDSPTQLYLQSITLDTNSQGVLQYSWIPRADLSSFVNCPVKKNKNRLYSGDSKRESRGKILRTQENIDNEEYKEGAVICPQENHEIQCVSSQCYNIVNAYQPNTCPQSLQSCWRPW